MKKNLFLLLLLTVTYTSYGQYFETKLFIDPEFSKYANNHKIIAVVPFVTSITLRAKQSEKLKEGQLEKMEEIESLNVQQSMCSWFVKRKEKGTMWVDVQDAKTTNDLLAEHRITYSNISEFTPNELAKILKVDAIVRGFYKTKNPITDLASFGLMLGRISGSTNESKINMFIHNSGDAKLLVQYTKIVSGSFGSSSDQLINALMRKASRRIPYTKPKE